MYVFRQGVAEAGLDFAVLLQFPECWNYRCAPPFLANHNFIFRQLDYFLFFGYYQ
jgi:hypothetical protein